MCKILRARDRDSGLQWPLRLRRTRSELCSSVSPLCIRALTMVRRRSSKSKAAHSKARPVDRKESKMRRWKTADDVPLDEEDQCAYFSALCRR